ncbi:LysR substrate-binding domain-containing protein [Janthinobacterium sp. RB2R34]|uniref:LysR family transcriptional regulator n=1 Tax=Janthinobacterium sp. RB2R34 TaxID=3424193 RepID=UPI003F1EF2A3
MDKIRAMKIFSRVVEAGSFAGAAKTLSLPRSTVSRSVQELEKALGVSLLQRTTRSLRLTSNGSFYHDHCRQMLQEIESVEASLSDSTMQPRGRLRVDMTSSFARTVVLPTIDGFLTRYPNLDIVLTLGDRPVDIIQEGLDCVVRSGTPESSALLVAKHIGSFDWITCASPDYLAQHGMPRSLEDLGHHHVIEFHSGRTGRAIEWCFGAENGEHLFRSRGRLAVNDTDAYISCGLEGLGIIRIAGFLARPHLKAGNLVRILPDEHGLPVPLSVLYPRSRHLSPAVRAFVDWMTVLLQDTDTQEA